MRRINKKRYCNMKIHCDFVVRDKEVEHVLKRICDVTKDEDILSFGYYLGDEKRKC